MQFRPKNATFASVKRLNSFKNMKISPKYKLRSMAGQNVVIMQGRYGGDMTKIISLNDSAAFLWNKFQGREFTSDEVTDALVEEYEIEREIALKDAEAWCAKLSENALVEE